MGKDNGRHRVRAIFISDIHLGTRGCKAKLLLDFLGHYDSEYLYLNGDIIDGWRLRRRWYWPQSHNDVIQALLRRAQSGTEIFYIPGNHDEAVRDFLGLQFGSVTIVEEAIHTTADGRRLLVTHGDRFDGVIGHIRWLSKAGAGVYVSLLWLNDLLNGVRRRLGCSYWSLAAQLKRRAKKAVKYLGNYRAALADEANRRQVDGIVCGHVHQAEISEYLGIMYCNDGDWIESCTALIEHHSGLLEIVHWPEPVTNLPTLIAA